MRLSITIPTPLAKRLTAHLRLSGRNPNEYVRALLDRDLPRVIDEAPPTAGAATTATLAPKPRKTPKPKTSAAKSAAELVRFRVSAAVAAYLEYCVPAGMPSVRVDDGMPGKTIARKVTARVKDLGASYDWPAYFQRAAGSAFLCGDNQRGWRASLDWLVGVNNHAKVDAGNYDGRPDGDRHSHNNSAPDGEDFGQF